jgi:hypothetical protein
MSRIVPFPTPSRREAVLDFVAQAGIGPEEQEFLEALRRIVARAPADELWDKYGGRRIDRRARVFGRYAD